MDIRNPLTKLNALERIILAVALLVIAAAIAVLTLTPKHPPAKYPGLGGDFTLQSANGPVSLSNYRDTVVLLMFGFTYCPDICPTGLANIAAVMARLNDQERQQIQPLFISVDPERDNVERLNDYARYFHPKIIGATADKTTLDKVVNQYGAFYQKVTLADSEMAYSVDHSARIYLIDRQGQLASLLYHNTPPGELVSEIRALLN